VTFGLHEASLAGALPLWPWILSLELCFSIQGITDAIANLLNNLLVGTIQNDREITATGLDNYFGETSVVVQQHSPEPFVSHEVHQLGIGTRWIGDVGIEPPDLMFQILAQIAIVTRSRMNFG
jgi:hypothetical protein